jgi:diguanylate cyclase (GGDEF)-like protein
MKKRKDHLNILAIALDAASTEAIKEGLKQNFLKFQISFLDDSAELEKLNNKDIDAVFIYSNRQSQKSIVDIRKLNLLIPRSVIILVSPRVDHHILIGAFRAGLFDFITLPIRPDEIRIIIDRLQMHEVIRSGKWNPERAVLHLFSRPESFTSMIDISSSLEQYLSLFLEIEAKTDFNSREEMHQEINQSFSLNSHQSRRIMRFIQDPTGLVFGLRYFKDNFHFLLKNGADKFSYIKAKNTSNYSIQDIINNHLINILRTSLAILSESEKRERMRTLSLTDEITGLYNQRKLLEDLEYYIARYPQEKRPFSLLFIDIDYFKNVNDQFGHVVGSQILIDMAEVLKSQLRSTDLVYRYGGDEFIIILPQSSAEESKKIAWRISEAVKKCEFNINQNQKYQLSLSIGIAEYPGDANSAKSILEFADKMMYMSKRSGRGKVFHVTEVLST